MTTMMMSTSLVRLQDVIVTRRRGRRLLPTSFARRRLRIVLETPQVRGLCERERDGQQQQQQQVRGGMRHGERDITDSSRATSLSLSDYVVVVIFFVCVCLVLSFLFLLPPPPRSDRGVKHHGQGARRMQGCSASLWCTITSSRHLLANHTASQGVARSFAYTTRKRQI